MPDGELIGGGDLTVETGGLECGLGRADEASELRGGASALEDGLVTNDNDLDEVPLSPLGDSIDLRLSTGDTGLRDEDTEDDLDAVLPGGGADVLEGGAVGAVDTDGSEALGGQSSDVAGDGLGRLAVTGCGVGRVGHAELVAVGCDTSGALRPTSRAGRAGRAGGRGRARLGVELTTLRLSPGRPGGAGTRAGNNGRC